MSLLRKGEIEDDPKVILRFKGAILVLAQTYAAEVPPANPTTKQLKDYRRRKKLAQSFGENPGHHAKYLATAILADAALTASLGNLTLDDVGANGSTLTQADSDAMDAAIITAAGNVADALDNSYVGNY